MIGLLLSFHELSSQPDLLETFVDTGCNTLAGCSGQHEATIITPSCIDGGVSHGSPHISGNEYVWIGSNVEGMYLNYSFQAGVEYGIYLRVRTLIGNIPFEDALLNLFATSDLTHDVGCFSGSTPNIPDKETIDIVDLTSLESGWSDLRITFCAEYDNEQFWIFPSGERGFSLNLDEVAIERTCAPSVVFTSSFLPSAYQTNGTITVSNASAIVQNNPLKKTVFRAEEEIFLEEQTLLSLAISSSEFYGVITPCGNGDCTRGGSGGPRRITPPSTPPVSLLPTSFDIFPNPASAHFAIKFSDDLLDSNDVESISLRIFDNIGRLVYSDNNFSPSDLVDTQQLSNGLYYVNLLINDLVTTKKLVIQN